MPDAGCWCPRRIAEILSALELSSLFEIEKATWRAYPRVQRGTYADVQSWEALIPNPQNAQEELQ
jgi:hypothetical protein